MEKEFIPYELALKLKELGFNEECIQFWYPSGAMNNSIPSYGFQNWYKTNGYLNAPLWQQAFDWFRDKHGLCYFINHSGRGYCSGWEDLGNNEHGFGNYSTYKEARLECLKKLIELSE